MQRQLDHDKDDSLDDMLGPVHPSIPIGSQNNPKFQFPTKGTSFGTLLEHQEHSLLDGILGSVGGINNGSLPMVNPLRRNLPLPSPFWTDETAAEPPTSKRFHGESDDGSLEKMDGNSSIATLLSQLPQSPPLQQQQQEQTMMGSIGDEIYRPLFQLPGLNWYS
ncbi:NAC domain class transcription factor isoform 1 [Hibiscus syriacus]|uniref:NAC domain class transcription factor isoform 1 n=1 Tax=Hibiscus syriacus TaxID=106335 RepID=A0A6A3BF38_HIBSY|nr:NAC domain class transcription factor isoform 1 [Hibiscus syriacus]